MPVPEETGWDSGSNGNYGIGAAQPCPGGTPTAFDFGKNQRKDPRPKGQTDHYPDHSLFF